MDDLERILGSVGAADARRGTALHRIGPAPSRRFAHKSIGASIDPASVDTRRLTVACVVSDESEDREGDVVVTAGIDLAQHRISPVVLYDHGLQGTLPVGKAEDGQGAYTVEAMPGRLRSVTHFSQSLLFAEQVFHLCAEGILRGVSIGCNILDAEHRRGGRVPGGLLVKRCEMFEYSHTPVGVNPHALADAVGKGMLCGRAIEAGLMKSLSPHLPALKDAVRGGWDPLAEAVRIALGDGGRAAKSHGARSTDTAGEGSGNDGGNGSDTGGTGAKAMSETVARTKAVDGMNTQTGADGGYVALPDPKDKEKALDGTGDDTATDPTGDWLPGAKVVAGIHGHLGEAAGAVEEGYGQQENPRIVAALDHVAGVVEEALGHLADVFASEYPDLDGLGGGVAGEGETKSETGEGEEEKDEDKDEDEDEEAVAYKSRMGKRLTEAGKSLVAARRKSVKVFRAAVAKSSLAVTKRLSRTAAATCNKAAECLDEVAGHTGELKGVHKTACGHHAAALKALAADPAAEEAMGEETGLKGGKAVAKSAAVQALEAENARLRAGLEQSDRDVKQLKAAFAKARRGR